MQFTPRSELEPRLAGFQTRLRRREIDGAFIMQKADLFYLSGTAQNGVLFVPAEGEPMLAVRRSITRARTESAWTDVVPYGRLKDLPALLEERGIATAGRFGLEMDVLPASFHLQFTKIFAEATFEDATPSLLEVRMVKSPYEIERVQRAAETLGAAFAEIPAMIRGGCEREIDLAAEIERALRRRRHQGVIRTRGFGREMFYGAVSAGATASYPTDFDGPDGVEGLYPAVPQSGGERRIRPGEPIMVDLCGGYDGYIADKTRIFVVDGLDDEEMLGAHAFALRIQDEVTARLKPGAHSGDIYRQIEALVKESAWADSFMGYGDNRSRFVGHGVGLELDELPVLTPRSKVELQEGMVLAVEPKFFFGDRGSVGIENTWVVTAEGCRRLTAENDEIVVV